MMGAIPILETLTHAEVDFVVIGMLAATLQGSPLRTDDLDVCPSSSPENLERLAKALTELEAREWEPRKGELVDRVWSSELLKADRLWILRTKHGPLDLLFRPNPTAGYVELREGAVTIPIDDLEVPVASLDDVIRMKEAANRDKDLAQLPTLRRLREKAAEKPPL